VDFLLLSARVKLLLLGVAVCSAALLLTPVVAKAQDDHSSDRDSYSEMDVLQAIVDPDKPTTVRELERTIKRVGLCDSVYIGKGGKDGDSRWYKRSRGVINVPLVISSRPSKRIRNEDIMRVLYENFKLSEKQVFQVLAGGKYAQLVHFSGSCKTVHIGKTREHFQQALGVLYPYRYNSIDLAELANLLQKNFQIEVVKDSSAKRKQVAYDRGSKTMVFPKNFSSLDSVFDLYSLLVKYKIVSRGIYPTNFIRSVLCRDFKLTDRWTGEIKSSSICPFDTVTF